MRTLRLSLAGTVMLTLLGGLGSAVVAQDAESAGNPDRDQSRTFDGSSTCPVHYSSTNTEWGIQQQRGVTIECNDEMSDPRVSGPLTITYDRDCYPWLGCVEKGTFRLAGPDGNWIGTYTASSSHLDEVSMLGTRVGEGTGAYAGWVYIAHWSTPQTMDFAVDGFIYSPSGPSPVNVNEP